MLWPMKKLALAIWMLTALSASAAPMGIIVPAYFYPGPLWNDMSFAASRVPLIAIMNPDNGPDNTLNPDYVAAVDDLRASGGRVIGYVYTSYGSRDTNAVNTDIDRYLFQLLQR